MTKHLLDVEKLSEKQPEKPRNLQLFQKVVGTCSQGPLCK